MASNSISRSKRYLNFDDENNSNKGDVNTSISNNITTPPNNSQLKKKQRSNAINELLFDTVTITRSSSHSTPNDIREIQQLPNKTTLSSSVHNNNISLSPKEKEPTNLALPLSPRKTVTTKPTLHQTQIGNTTFTTISAKKRLITQPTSKSSSTELFGSGEGGGTAANDTTSPPSVLDTGGNVSNNTTAQSTATSVSTYEYGIIELQLQLFLQQHHPKLFHSHSLTCSTRAELLKLCIHQHPKLLQLYSSTFNTRGRLLDMCDSRAELELLTNKKVRQIQPTEEQFLQNFSRVEAEANQQKLLREKLRRELQEKMLQLRQEEKSRQEEKLCRHMELHPNPTLNYEEITQSRGFFARELWKTLPQPLQAKFTLLADCWDAKNNVVLEEKREQFNTILDEIEADTTSVEEVEDYRDIALLLRTKTHSETTIHNIICRDVSLTEINAAVHSRLVTKKRNKKIVLINVRPWEEATPLAPSESDEVFKKLLINCGYSEVEAVQKVAKANADTTTDIADL